LHFLSLQELALQLQSRALSPVNVTRYRLLDRIAQIDGYLKIHATLTPEQALADARTTERDIRAGKYRGPLHGDRAGLFSLVEVWLEGTMLVEVLDPAMLLSIGRPRCCGASSLESRQSVADEQTGHTGGKIILIVSR
jgi:hypothetical protein